MTATAGDGAPPMFAGALPANPDFQRQFTDYENAEQFAARNSAPQRSKLGHLFYVGIGWATIVGGSISYSLLTPSKAHLLMSQRVIHARLYAQWCAPLGSTTLAIARHRPNFPMRGRAGPRLAR